MALELEKVEIRDMQIPVFANVTGGLIKSKEEIKDLLVKQVSNTVKWTNTIVNLISEGVDIFVEIGPGKVLSGLIKKTDREVNILNVEDLATLSKAIDFLKAVKE